MPGGKEFLFNCVENEVSIFYTLRVNLVNGALPYLMFKIVIGPIIVSIIHKRPTLRKDCHFKELVHYPKI